MEQKISQNNPRVPTPDYAPPAWAYAHYQNRHPNARATATRRRVLIAILATFWLVVVYTGFNVYRTHPVNPLSLSFYIV